MSGERRRSWAPQDPPWSPELLADLHAGALDDQTADELFAQVRHDPEATDLLAALDATATQLGEQPEPTVPDAVAGRIEAALSREIADGADPQTTTGPQAAPQWPVPEQPQPVPEQPRAGSGTGAQVADLAAARRRRTRRALQVGGVLAGAAAVVGAIVLAGVPPERNNTQLADPGRAPEPNQPVEPNQPGGSSVDTGQSPPLALRGEQVSLSGPQLSEVLSSEQYDALTRPEQLVGCLQANGVTSGKPIGARAITLNDQPAQLLIVPSGQIGQFRLLAVGPGCGPGEPATLSDSTVGG